MRGGTGASTQRAKAGSHSDTGRGSSSMTLYVPGSAVIAATVAATASSIWTNDQTPEPSPMIVDMPLRTCPPLAPSGRYQAPGDRKSVGEGKSVSVRVESGGRRIIKKKK